MSMMVDEPGSGLFWICWVSFRCSSSLGAILRFPSLPTPKNPQNAGAGADSKCAQARQAMAKCAAASVRRLGWRGVRFLRQGIATETVVLDSAGRRQNEHPRIVL